MSDLLRRDIASLRAVVGVAADRIEALTAERDRLLALVAELETPDLFWDVNGERRTDDLRDLTEKGEAVGVVCARMLPGRCAITMPDMTAKLFDTHDGAEAAYRAALANLCPECGGNAGLAEKEPRDE